jgi:hypothetical protein
VFLVFFQKPHHDLRTTSGVRRYACPPAEVFGARRFVVVALRETTFDNFFFPLRSRKLQRNRFWFYLYGHCDLKWYFEPISTLQMDQTTVLKAFFDTPRLILDSFEPN